MNRLRFRHLALVLAFISGGYTSSAQGQGAPPTIIAQPRGLTVTVGSDAMFHVSAFGRKSPVTYQWRFNNQPILNATNNAYTRANVQLADAGNYSVSVRNASGATLSMNAVLAVDLRRLYWDTDAATPGPGSSAPFGSWSDAFWSLSPAGSSGTSNWVPGSIAFFAAGDTAFQPYSILVNAEEILSGINFEEGEVTIEGNGALSLDGNGTLSVGAGLRAQIQTVIGGEGSLIKTGDGLLEIGAVNSYAGDTIISAGTLLLDDFGVAVKPEGSLVSLNGFAPLGGGGGGGGGRIPDQSAVTVFQGAILDLNSTAETIGSLDGSGTVEANEGSLTVGANNRDSFFDGHIDGFGELTKIGSGRLTLTDDNDLSAFFLNGGAIEIARLGALGAGTITVGAGASELISSMSQPDYQNDIHLEEGSIIRLIDLDESTFRLSGAISGDGAIVRGADDDGQIILSGDNDFTGGVTIEGGSLRIGSSAALGTGTFTISAGDPNQPIVLLGSLGLLDEDAIPNPVTVERSFTVASRYEMEFSGPIDISGSSVEVEVARYDVESISTLAPLRLSGPITGDINQLIKAGPGTLKLSGDNDYIGATLVQEGTLEVLNFEGSATGTGPVTIGSAQGSGEFPGETLTGYGTIFGEVTLFGTISPGVGPGPIFTGSQTWRRGAHYLWEINDASGSEGGEGGAAHDTIRISGTLTIAATPNAPFNFDVSTLTPDNSPGSLVNFDEALPYSWRIVGTTDGVTGFDPAAIQMDVGSLPTEHGSFFLAVENDGLDLVLHYAPDTGLPLVRVTSPEEISHTTSPVITVRGVASDDFGVEAVLYQIGDGEFQTANGTSQWSAQVPLSLGTNVVTIKAVDTSGNDSKLVQRTIILDETAPLTIEIIGMGQVTPNLNGQFLAVGQSYTVTAIPGPTNAFSAWSGDVESTDPELTFVMAPDLILRATFVPGRVFTGTYNGLFYENEIVRHESSGFFTFRLTSRGSYSGKILIDGGAHRIAGNFNDAQESHLRVNRSGKAALNVSLRINPATGEVTGEVATEEWTSALLGDLAFASGDGGTAPQAGTYTMSMTGFDDDEDSTRMPHGDSFATLTVNSRGAVRMTGRLSDNVPTRQSTSLSRNGVWPFYDSLYRGKGSILGWITFTNREQSSLEGNLNWTKMGGAGGQLFREGFTNPVVALGSTYVRPEAGTRVLEFSEGRMFFQDGNLPEPFSVGVMLNHDNRLSVDPESPNRVRVGFGLRNGLLRGSFTHPGSGKKMAIRSVVLQQSGEGRGYFVGKDETGSVRLRGEDD